MSEFSTIDKITAIASVSCAKSKKLLIPPGDDAALLCPIQRPVISTDTQREGIHFNLHWQSPRQVGYKAVCTALSDLAASYAKPIACFVNLAIPSDTPKSLPEELYSGLNRALMEFDCSLGGGNISTASQLSLDLFVIGEGSKLFPKRSEARPGENIYVSGPIGLARAGLDLLQKEISGFPSLIKAFVSPRPDFESSNYLEASCVRCVMDISDGLAGDAYHLAKASGITVEFIINPENYDPSHKAYCTRFGKSVVTEMIAGGEDYCLLFTCKEALYESKLKKILVDSFQVGRCLPFQGVYLKNIPKDCQSFQHTV